MKSTTMLGMTAVLAAALSIPATSNVYADTAALTGKVTSDAEGAMEGVVVTAHKDGSSVTVSVTTDATGQYSFPQSRLEPGHYTLALRAVGYEPSAASAADIVAAKTATADVKLAKVTNTDELAHQLTNAEWMM